MDFEAKDGSLFRVTYVFSEDMKQPVLEVEALEIEIIIILFLKNVDISTRRVMSLFVLYLSKSGSFT